MTADPVNRVLRDLAWGQTRRASIAEGGPEVAQEDQLGACTGFDAMICRDIFGTDNIHPNNSGYQILREKVWEGSGGINLGPKDALGRTGLASADYGFLKRIRRAFPARAETAGGASVQDGSFAFDDADGGGPAPTPATSRVAPGAGA